jgi:hypothetical protein
MVSRLGVAVSVLRGFDSSSARVCSLSRAEESSPRRISTCLQL